MLLAPVNRHQECPPRHPRLDHLAEREIIEASENLADIAHLGENDELAEDRDRAHAAKHREGKFEKPEMAKDVGTESVALPSAWPARSSAKAGSERHRPSPATVGAEARRPWPPRGGPSIIESGTFVLMTTSRSYRWQRTR